MYKRPGYFVIILKIVTTKLILIRHGETDWNHQKRYCSFTDVDLNKHGFVQAEKLSKRMAGEKIRKVYSSNLKRAISFSEKAFNGIPKEILPGLKEFCFGAFEGLTYQELMGKYPHIYSRWLENPQETRIPEGDDLTDFAKKVKSIIETIVSENPDSTIAIVTHGGTLRVVAADVLGLELKEIQQIKISSASISIVEYEAGRINSHFFNDTSYLYE